MSKILIVDDNTAVLEVVSELVAAAGFTSITASGGKECLEKVATENPDLILLDINMPDIDGWSVLRQLKEKGLTNRIKVVMLTATTDIGTDIFGLQDVVSGYIRKPFTNSELAESLKAVLGQTSDALLEVKEKEPSGFARLFGRGKTIGTASDGMEKAMKSAKKYE
ncbi:MAG: response regulator, partial [Methanomassiliicoccales archaeon]|nr:response regulator [Methanomassiliicoccales archaeon]